MFKKHKLLFKRLDDYLDHAQDCLRKFHDAIEYVAEKGVDEHFDVLASEISEKEQNCDEIRRTIEHAMFSEFLLPETREDLMEIIEKMDSVPNHCDDVSSMISDQRSEILPAIRCDMIELLKICLKTFQVTIAATRDCFGRMDNIAKLVAEVDDYENLGKRIQRKMIKAIFESKKLETHPGGRLIQKEIVTEIGEICGLCKHISEKIMITAIKRRV